MANKQKRKSIFESSKYKLPEKSEDMIISPASIALRAGAVLRKGFEVAQRRALIKERATEAAGVPMDLEPPVKQNKKSNIKPNVDVKGKSTKIVMKPKNKIPKKK